MTLLLHLVVIGVTASAVSFVDGRDLSAFLVPMAVGGLALGFVLARTNALDTFAHFIAFFSAIAVALTAGAVRIDGWPATFEARGRNVVDLADRLVTAFVLDPGTAVPVDDLAVLIGVTLWLVGHSSSWMLHRRHWLFPALFLPGVIVLVGVRFDERAPAGLLLIFGAAALVMIARHHAFLRQAEWARHQVPAPAGVPSRFVASGSVIAALALALGWSFSYEAPEHVKDRVFDRAQTAWSSVSERLERLGDVNGRGGLSSGTYSTFADSFAIGGEFNPSPDPVAALSAIEPAYLALRRYDAYSGFGWSSNVDATFRMDGDSGDVPATSVTFAPNQQVALSADTSQARENRAGVVTVFEPKDGLLFTTDTFVAASERSVAIIGWRKLPEFTIEVNAIDPTDVPIDLQGLVRSLRNAQVVPSESGPEPVILDQELARQVSEERRRLLSYPVVVELSLGENGELVMTASGRVPNYDDVEAVFAGDRGPRADRYRVIGAKSIANETDLRTAGEAYPVWITDRYLQLPTTVTERTFALADQVVRDAGAGNPFDKAWAIQEYLQSDEFSYALNSETPPRDRDIVDFFLFDSRVGRCEHYATAMVVMLRAEGIPARLVAGYRESDERDSSGDFLYREELAHTWVEAFFPGFGWIPFEPTWGQPPFDYDSEPDPRSELPEQSIDEMAEPTPTPEPEIAPESSPQALPPISSTTSDGEAGGGLGGGLAWAGAALTLLLALTVATLAGVWVWSLRGFCPAAALYQRTIRIGRLWGVEPRPTMTPAEYAAEWSRTVPRAGGAVRLVTDLYANERYGGVELSEEVGRGGRDAWREVRSAVVRWRPWGRRRRG